MGNVGTYVKKYCEQTVKQRCLALEDAVVLCALSYLIFENVLSPFETKKLSELYPFIDKLKANAVLARSAQKLYRHSINSNRYKDVIIENFINDFNPSDAVQFEAMTFRFDEDNLFIVFRGTDASFTGWKEDFFMTIKGLIPSQVKAKEYLEKIICGNKGKKIYVAGHSKGGNLTTYALLNISESSFNLVECAFDLDGPGFKEDIFSSELFKQRKEKLVRIIPYEDVIGQLMNANPDYLVVKSSLSRIAQHIIYAWHFKNGKVVLLPRLSKFSIKFNQRVNKWLKSLSDEDILMFINQVNLALDKAKIDRFNDLSKNTLSKLKSLIKSYLKIEKNQKKHLKKLVRQFFKIYIRSIF